VVPDNGPREGVHEDSTAADADPAKDPVIAEPDKDEWVNLDHIDFAPILARAEQILAEARRLAVWAGDGPSTNLGPT
jgi:hypothetical protein